MALCKDSEELLSYSVEDFVGLNNKILKNYDSFYDEIILDENKKEAIESLLESPTSVINSLPPSPIVASSWRNQNPKAFVVLRTIENLADFQSISKEYIAYINSTSSERTAPASQLSQLKVSDLVDLEISQYGKADFPGTLTVTELLSELCKQEMPYDSDSILKLDIQRIVSKRI